ncbi:unnamed protein product, partial [Pylaiella littoralis]
REGKVVLDQRTCRGTSKGNLQQLDLDDLTRKWSSLHDELTEEDGELQAQTSCGATMDNLEDYVADKTRWSRKGVPRERFWWNLKAYKLLGNTPRMASMQIAGFLFRAGSGQGVRATAGYFEIAEGS